MWDVSIENASKIQKFIDYVGLCDIIKLCKGGESLKDRIKQIRKHFGLSQAEFGQRVGVKGNTIGNYEIGLRAPSDAVIFSICREFNISESWLRTGEGEMLDQADPDTELAKIFGQIAGSDDDLIKAIIKSYWMLDDKDKAAVHKLVDRFLDEMNKKKTPGE